MVMSRACCSNILRFPEECLCLKNEYAGCAQTDGGNSGIAAQFPSVVAVPRYALAAVGIKVEQAGVEYDGQIGAITASTAALI